MIGKRAAYLDENDPQIGGAIKRMCASGRRLYTLTEIGQEANGRTITDWSADDGKTVSVTSDGEMLWDEHGEALPEVVWRGPT